MSVVVDGAAEGPVVGSAVPLSLWGGVDPATGVVIDRHHPLCGASLEGAILVLPAGRGSSSASAVLLEILHGGHGPAGIVLGGVDEILAIGVVVAEELLGISIPLVAVGPEELAAALAARHARIDPGGRLTLSHVRPGGEP